MLCWAPHFPHLVRCFVVAGLPQHRGASALPLLPVPPPYSPQREASCSAVCSHTTNTQVLAGQLLAEPWWQENTAVSFILQLFPELSFLLQFVLKHKEFAHLREVKMFPNALNPHKEESRALVKAMIDQVMALHEDVKWFHIGCDEVGLPLSQEFFLLRNGDKGWGFCISLVPRPRLGRILGTENTNSNQCRKLFLTVNYSISTRCHFCWSECNIESIECSFLKLTPHLVLGQMSIWSGISVRGIH